MKPGYLVKYKERYSFTGVDRGSLIGIVVDTYKDLSRNATHAGRNEQARVQWSYSLMRGELSWWVYLEDLNIISES